jgi:UDPglucose 6-dehydrogenase
MSNFCCRPGARIEKVMKSPRVGIVGYGVVGKAHHDAFVAANIETAVFDKYDPRYSGTTEAEAVNRCDLVFIAVPTPSGSDGSCDLSAVEEAVGWIERPICIKSTIPPGTTNRLVAETQKRIVFSPEYTGETAFHPHKGRLSANVVAVGGYKETAELVVHIYTRVLGPQPIYIITDAVTAELAKYMENCFFATKVAFVAQFYLLAHSFGADFTSMREIWAADDRIGRSHSTVVGSPGFAGRCLPKDLSAILAAAKAKNCSAPLLEAVDCLNRSLRDDLEDDPVR